MYLQAKILYDMCLFLRMFDMWIARRRAKQALGWNGSDAP